MLTAKQKIYAGMILAAVVTLAAVTHSAWSAHNLARMEKRITAAQNHAAETETHARELEQKAAAYQEKIDYLSASLADLGSIAKEQDEKLKQLANETNNARDGVRRARSVVSIESTNDKLCAKLAELGHPCGE